MKPVLMILAVLVVAASAGVVGFLVGRGAAPGEAEKEEEKAPPVAKVTLAPARTATIGKSVVAYGVVRAAPEAVHLFSVQFESRVRHFQVTPGQIIAAGTVLVEVDPSPSTLLQVQQARTAVESATKKLAQAKHAAALQLLEARATRDSAAKVLAQTERRVEMKLGTNQELLEVRQLFDLAQMRLASIEKLDTTPEILTAQQDLTTAELQLASLGKLGINTPQVKAEMAGIVSNLITQEGQIVPAGGPLVELAEEKRIEVRLGVDPGDAAGLRADQPIQITAVNDKDAKPIEGRLRLITRRVNPANRLVEVFVSLPPDAKLLLESYVRGRATTGEKQALVVPRAAVLPEEEGKRVLFTVKDGKAVEHEVKTGLEDDEVVEIVGQELKAGEAVVVQGNYELEDGMAVEIEKPSDEKEAPAHEKDKAPKAEKKTPAPHEEKAP